MQTNITLSSAEKRHYFLYLLGMLLVSVLLISFIVLYKAPSPFSEADLHSVMILEEKTKFTSVQRSQQSLQDSTFIKLEKFDAAKNSIIDENKINVNISQIQNTFKLTNSADQRKMAYPQIAKFGQMFLDDKKNAALIEANTKLFKKQFEDCSVGYRDRKQQAMDRENALMMSGGR